MWTFLVSVIEEELVMAAVFEELDREWERLAASATFREAWRGWQRSFPVLGEVDGLVNLPGWLLAQEPAVTDPVVSGLLVEGSEVAARVVFQVLQPGIRGACRSLRWTQASADDVAAVVLAAAWRQIRVGRPPKRAVCVLLVRSIRRDARRAADRLGPGVELVPVEALESVAALPEVAHPCEELLELLSAAVGQGILDRRAAALVGEMRLGTRRVTDVAREIGCTTRTVRRRRVAAEQALLACHHAAS